MEYSEMDIFQISKNILQLGSQNKVQGKSTVSLCDYEKAFENAHIPLIRKKIATVFKHIFHDKDTDSVNIEFSGDNIIFHIVFKN